MCNYKSELLIGFWEGIFGGLGVFLIKLLYDFYLQKRDEKRIINFLKNTTNFEWHNTYRIAAGTNITEDRVRFICYISNKIDRSEKEKEVWNLK